MFEEECYFEQEFNGLNASSEEFNGLEFEACCFKNCDFSDSVFKACKFIDCEFIQSNLSLMQLPQTRFSEVELSDCKAIGIDWTRLNWPTLSFAATISFKRCQLNDGNFFGLMLAELQLLDCQAYRLDLREADLNNACFSGSELSASLFQKTNLSSADFVGASDYQIDIFQNTISGAKFERLQALSLLEGLDIELVD